MSILNEALATGGNTLKPAMIGDTVGGTITGVEVRQTTNYESGDPEFWADGKPKQQIVVTVQPDDADEEGSIYIKAWGSQKKELNTAIAATGLNADQALKVGNGFHCTWVGETPNAKNPRLNPTKDYTFKITPKTAGLGDALATPTTAQVPAQATPPAPATPAPASSSAGGQVDVNALINAGLTDEQVAAASGLDATVVATLRANLGN